MKNIFISNLHEKDVEHCTTDVGLYLRRIGDKPFKKLCNAFTNANIIRQNDGQGITDEEYFESLDEKYIPAESYDIKPTSVVQCSTLFSCKLLMNMFFIIIFQPSL
jgi:hypothetical protein